ncbi:cysteine-rich CWC family protein [Massilia sp. PWRC2]|uniref:cysteine-rich CWC family protein n=1 Tax=Massilia sp. PWRC2 TaxID=2804626 RepID=UPI003CF10C3C
MSACSRCGAPFDCAMVDGSRAPCWCMALPAALPVPGPLAACWCPACLYQHMAELERARAAAAAPDH